MLLLSVLTNTSIAKAVYGLGITYSTLGIMQASNATNSGFFETLLQNVPAQLIYILAIIYGVSLVLSRLSDTWTKHRMNNLKVRKEKEAVEKAEIETEITRKDL